MTPDLAPPRRSGPLRVLYSFPHPLDRPGIAHTAHQQVLGLAAQGLDVVLLCTSVGAAQLPPSVRVVQTMVVAGRRIPHRAVGVQRAYSFHDAVVARWLRRHAADVDLVHAWPRGCLRTLRTAAALGITALRESPNPHTASVQRESARAAEHAGVPLARSSSHAQDAGVLAREVREYDAAAYVLVPSAYAHREFVAEGVDPARLLRHRYGCDLARFPARGPRPADRPFTAAFLGRGDPTKGLHVALDAWARAAVPGGRFLVAGQVEPAYRARLQPLLARPGVEELGFVDDPSTLLREADVLLLPSWTEGSALVATEAMASGCVPLTSDASGVLGTPDVDHLEHAVGDVDALTGHITRLADDRELLAALSERGTARRADLSWGAAAEVLVSCYTRSAPAR